MRSLIPLALVACLTGCASKGKIVTTKQVPILPQNPAGTYLNDDTLDNIREQGQYGSYYAGRRIDPSDPDTMLERGRVYRRERSESWNLNPNDPLDVQHQARQEPNKANPLMAELEQELKKQQLFAAALIEQNNVLTKERALQTEKLTAVPKLLEEVTKNQQELAKTQATLLQMQTTLQSLQRAENLRQAERDEETRKAQEQAEKQQIEAEHVQEEKKIEDSKKQNFWNLKLK